MVLKRLYICLYFFLNTDFIFKFFYKLFNNKMIVIYGTIMKYCRIFFWCLRIQIAKITSSSSIFTSKMTMISNFFITSTKFVFALCGKLFGFNVIFLYLSMISFLFFMVYYFHYLISYIFAKLSDADFTSTIIKTIFCCIRWTTCKQVIVKRTTWFPDLNYVLTCVHVLFFRYCKVHIRY